MVTHSTVEGHDKKQSPSSSTSSSSSSSSSSSISSSALTRHQPSSTAQGSELQRLEPQHTCPDRFPLVLQQAACEPDTGPFPIAAPLSTHFPPFRCQKDFKIITEMASKLEHSGFYWGPLGVEEAHSMLRNAVLGSFLIRDSRQKDVFFTLSYRARTGPISVRIVYKRQRFSLAGSERSFQTLFTLLEHYINSSKKSLSIPYRKRKPTLQELCRKSIMQACGGGERQVLELPINSVLQNFLSEFPYKL